MSTPGGRRVVCVAAVARNGVIGDGPDIPWKVPGEQAEFKRRTLGHTLLMGRTTFESIGRPLPGRTTIVLSRDAAWTRPGVLVARSLDEAIRRADQIVVDGTTPDVIVAGGAQLYADALAADALVDEQALTEIPLEPAGDAHYPGYLDLDDSTWPVVEVDEHDGFRVVVRRRAG